jgi:hypothetical protein
MGEEPRMLEVGDHVKFRDSAIAARGLIISEITHDYVEVQWQDIEMKTTHLRASLEVATASARSKL